MPRNCDICGGRETITLTVIPRINYLDLESGPQDYRTTRRDYPCPECGPAIPQNKFCVLSRTTPLERLQMDRAAFAESIEHKKRYLAHKLIDGLVDRRAIHFDFTENAPHLEVGMSELVATIGVASPVDTLTFQARVDEAGFRIAKRVADDCKRVINRWGICNSILKTSAANLIDGAVRSAEHLRGRPV